MDLPGEKLVIRLIETIEKCGLGLFRPWQIKRIARAEAIARQETALTDLITEQKIAKIALNQESAKPPSNLLVQSSLASENIEIAQDIPSALIAEQARKLLNTSKVLEKTRKILANDLGDPPNEFIEADWLFRWRESASAISDELLQEIWANVLAAELKRPGEHSLRTIDFLRNLSRSEAEVIESVAPYVVNGNAIIFGSGVKFSDNLPPHDFKCIPSGNSIDQLEELGLLNTQLGLGFNFQKSTEFSNGYFGWIFLCHGRAVAATSLTKERTLRLSHFRFTKLGQDVLKLVKSSPNDPHLQELAKYLANEGFDSEILDYQTIGDGKIRTSNEIKITPSCHQFQT